MALFEFLTLYGVALAAFAGCAALTTVRWIHLVFFHPLAEYPGPLLGKFTDLYAAYHAWKGDIHLDMWRCHERYGDRVRYGPNKLLFNTAEALHDIHHSNNSNKFIKATAYLPLIHRSPNTLTIRDHKNHARRRRLMAQGVSERAQRGYEHRLLTHIDVFCGKLFPSTPTNQSRDGWSGNMDMSQWCYYLSFDVMADVVFGARYNLLEQEQFRYVIQAIDESNVRLSTLIQIPRLAALKLDKYVFRRAISARNRFIKFVVRIVKDRLAKDKSRCTAASHDVGTVKGEESDLFAHLAAAIDPETGLGFQGDEIHAESTTLIIAGSDTSSTAMSALFFYLATNPSVYERAAAEVRSKFTCRSSIVMGAALVSCTYLRACVDESLRMSPSVGSALWREVLPGDAIIDGKVVRAGCDVGVSIYSIQHSPTYYTEPFKYRPERWIVDDETGSIARARSAFNPFSTGTRGCLGKGLAMTELMLTMATVMFVGDFKLADGDARGVGRGHEGASYGRHRHNEYQLWDHVTAQKEGPILQFFSRVC